MSDSVARISDETNIMAVPALRSHGPHERHVVRPADFHEFVNAIKELGVFWAMTNAPEVAR